jgi:HlyD family secretion protein
MNSKWEKMRPLAVPIGLAVGVLLLGWVVFRPPQESVQGEVECREVDVAAKVPGRLAEVPVEEGQKVKRGDVLAVFGDPDIVAKTRQAKEGMEAAQSDQVLAEKTFKRIEALYKEGVVSAQKRDEAEAALKARNGANAAEARYEEAKSYLDEVRVTAPIDGEVVERLADPGEVVPAGYPVVHLVDVTDSWITFHVREDLLKGLRSGDRLKADVPALGAKGVDLTVSVLAAQASYATWRATRASGGFDLKTFEVRVRFTHPLEGVRPGMSVWVHDWEARKP